MSDEEPSSTPPADDYAAFLADLKAAYDNPEVYGARSKPQILRLRIWSYLLANYPTFIRVEIDADILAEVLVEAMIEAFSFSPDLPEILERHGANSVEEFRRAYEEEDPVEAEGWKIAHQRFFLRHFPKILQAAYGITVTSSIMGVGLARWRQEPDTRLNEMEEVARAALGKQIADFEKLIKAIVATRTSGRPRIYETGPVPNVVALVLNTAVELMGNVRGKDAVPGLDAVALKLNTNADALGLRLRRVGHPWTKIRTHLENLPNESDKN